MEQAGDLIAGLAGEADDGADLAGPGFGELGHARLEQVADFLEIDAALRRGHARPGAGVERLAGGRDGEVDIGRGRLDILQDGFLGVRRDHVEDDAARAWAPLAVDEQARGATRLDATKGFQIIVHCSLLKTRGVSSGPVRHSVSGVR